MAVTQNTYTGNGSTVLFSFTFPYLETTDIKVSVNGTNTTAYTLANATTIQFNTAPANGAAIRIYRQTDDAALAATFYPGSAIRSSDLNENFTQNLYVTQESSNNATSATTTANTALTNSNTAISTANSAVSTANTASSNASAAVSTANTASSNASAAVSTANTASSNATTAVNTANAATATANSATSTANTALSTANAATSTANAASTAATTAVNTANAASSASSSAVSTANTASTNASNAVTTANTASTNATTAVNTANTAVTTANAAAAAVANAVLYTTVANVAAIPASPANNTAIEVTNSTGIESFTPLSGKPAGFIGSSGLSVRIIYQTTGSTWTWIQYFPNDPETRYLKTGSTGTVTSTMIADGTIADSDINPAAAISLSKLATGALPTAITVASSNIVDGTIVNDDIKASAAIAGTKISPNFGNQNVTTTGVISAAAGAEGTPSIAFTGDLNTGIYSPGADQVAISTNGTGRLFVDANGLVDVQSQSASVTRIGGGASLFIRRAEGSYSSPTAVSSSVSLGGISARGYGTTDYRAIGNILFFSEGAVSDSSSPGSIVFNTTPSASVTPQERLRITSDGKVGVGTSAPDNPLHVVGAASTTFTNNPIVLKLTSSNTFAAGVGGGISFTGKYNSGGAFADLAFISGIKENATDGDYAGALVLGTRPNGSGGGSMERLRITSGGNVGIGTTSPATPLEVSGTSAQIRVIDSAVDMRVLPLAGGQAGIFGTASNHSLVLWTNSTERARIDGSGRLLVGTSTSVASLSGLGAQFQVNEGGGVAASLLRSTNDVSGANLVFRKTRDTTPTGATVVQSGDSLGNIYWMGTDGTNAIAAAQITVAVDGTPGANDMPGRLVFSTTADGASSPTERMRITNGGSVYFGVTSDPSGTVGGSAFLVAGSDRKILRLATTTTAAVGLAEFYNANGSVGAIATSGTSTSFNTSSDYRLKENVTAVTDGITRLQQLKPSRFNFIADPAKTVDGFLAHEVQSVVPEAITGEKDAVDDDGNPIYQGIDQSKLVPLLTAALQEAVAKIESLEARLTAAGI